MVYWGPYPNGRSSKINGRETHRQGGEEMNTIYTP